MQKITVLSFVCSLFLGTSLFSQLPLFSDLSDRVAYLLRVFNRRGNLLSDGQLVVKQ